MRSACIVDAASVAVTPDCLTYCASYIISLCELGGKSGVGVSKRGMMPCVGGMVSGPDIRSDMLRPSVKEAHSRAKRALALDHTEGRGCAVRLRGTSM